MKLQTLGVRMTQTQSVSEGEANAGGYSRLSQPALRQVKHLSGIQDPHKHL